MAATPLAGHLRRSARIVTRSRPHETPDRRGDSNANAPAPSRAARRRIKTEPPPARPDLLRARKLRSFAAYSAKSPFPTFPRPTPQDCALAHAILARLHGDGARPDRVVAPTAVAGCGASPSVLDALVRTILSQNTSDRNSARAKQSMDAVYGGSDKWDAIVHGGQARLQRAIQSGGLSVVKSRAIIGILRQVKAKYGVYSLDHLFRASDDDAMREMLSFQGVGPKTASCVLLFCLGRESFAVDTHVYRITGLLGWRPAGATREETQAHLDAVVPAAEKYPLHVLLISHGRQCDACKAGGKKSLGRCELRRAFDGKAGEELKKEEEGLAGAMKREEEEEGLAGAMKREEKEKEEEEEEEEEEAAAAEGGVQ